MKNLMFKVVLSALMIVSAKGDVTKVEPLLIDSELNYGVELSKGVYRCVTIKSDAKKVLIDSLREKNGMSGYIIYKLKFFNSENLVGTNYVIKISSLEQEYGFDVFSHKSTCMATANYKNGN